MPKHKQNPSAKRKRDHSPPGSLKLHDSKKARKSTTADDQNASKVDHAQRTKKKDPKSTKTGSKAKKAIKEERFKRQYVEERLLLLPPQWDHHDDLPLIEAELEKVKFRWKDGKIVLDKDSSQLAIILFKRKLRNNAKRSADPIPGWLAAAARVMSKDNEFLPKNVEELRDAGIDPRRVCLPGTTVPKFSHPKSRSQPQHPIAAHANDDGPNASGTDDMDSNDDTSLIHESSDSDWSGEGDDQEFDEEVDSDGNTSPGHESSDSDWSGEDEAPEQVHQIGTNEARMNSMERRDIQTGEKIDTMMNTLNMLASHSTNQDQFKELKDQLNSLSHQVNTNTQRLDAISSLIEGRQNQPTASLSTPGFNQPSNLPESQFDDRHYPYQTNSRQQDYPHRRQGSTPPGDPWAATGGRARGNRHHDRDYRAGYNTYPSNSGNQSHSSPRHGNTAPRNGWEPSGGGPRVGRS